jgi:hypothetical protein
MITTREMKNEPVWDKTHSTYLRIIYLKNGYTLTGYSKKVGRNERINKVDLLTNWILRDFKNGYLDKATTNPRITPVDRIEYYTKKGDAYEPIVWLYYDYANWINPKWTENRKLVAFIERLYFLIQKGKDAAAISNELEIRTRAPKQDPLDISIKRFLNLNALNAYMIHLRSESDLPQESIDHFYRKYKEKYFGL